MITVHMCPCTRTTASFYALCVCARARVRACARAWAAAGGLHTPAELAVVFLPGLGQVLPISLNELDCRRVTGLGLRLGDID
jgi:hypothetical protein